MNHIFRVVFNKSKGVFVAVSELVKSHGKEKSEQGASGLSPIFTKGFALVARRDIMNSRCIKKENT